MEELKACPFCGGEAVERCFDGYDAIQCDNCGQVIILPQHGCGKEHIAAFNRRAEPIGLNSRSADALEKLILDIEDRMTLDVRERVVLRDAVAALRRAAPENKVLTITLPCKVGDKIYSIQSGELLSESITSFETRNGEFCACADYCVIIKFSDFGKTVFLTREAAEQALAARRPEAAP